MVWGNTTYSACYGCAPPAPPMAGFAGMGPATMGMGNVPTGLVNPGFGGIGPSPTAFNVGNPFNLPTAGLGNMPSMGLGGNPFMPTLGGFGNGFGASGGFPLGSPGIVPGGGGGPISAKQAQNALLVDQLFSGVVQALIRTFMMKQQQKQIKAAQDAKQAKIDEQKQLDLQKRQEKIELQKRRAMAKELSKVLHKLPEESQDLAKALIAEINAGGDVGNLPDEFQQRLASLNGGAPGAQVTGTGIDQTIGVSGVPPSYETMMANLNNMNDGPAGSVEQAREYIVKSAINTANQMNTTGKCAKGVGDALRAVGINVKNMSAYNEDLGAYNMSEALEEQGAFEEIDLEDEELLPGDVLVYGATDKKEHGHTSIYLGNGKEASDHVQALTDPSKYDGVQAYRYVS